jgi:hypothetical protein
MRKTQKMDKAKRDAWRRGAVVERGRLQLWLPGHEIGSNHCHNHAQDAEVAARFGVDVKEDPRHMSSNAG